MKWNNKYISYICLLTAILDCKWNIREIFLKVKYFRAIITVPVGSLAMELYKPKIIVQKTNYILSFHYLTQLYFLTWK